MRKTGLGNCGCGRRWVEDGGQGKELPQVSKSHRQSQFALADDRTCRRMRVLGMGMGIGVSMGMGSWTWLGSFQGGASISVCCSLRGAFDVQQAVVKCRQQQQTTLQAPSGPLSAFCLLPWLLSDYNHHDKYSIYPMCHAH